MSAYYYGPQHHPPSTSHSSHGHHNNHGHNNHHHGGRSRRAPRLSSQNSHRPFRGVRSMKELTEPPPVSAFRLRFEAGRSFDLDDDLEFCPGLLTEDDMQSYHSSSSDGSLSSDSPHSSPVQPQIQPSQQVQPTFSLASASNSNYNPVTGFQSSNNQAQVKLHQPAALRTRNAIPIVNPSTGMRVPSPPSSISPAMMQQQQQQQQTQYSGRRW